MPTCKICGKRSDSEFCFRHKPRKPIRGKKDRGAYFDVYLKAFGYDPGDTPICEITGRPADQIHHMTSRGAGGSDEPENLIAVTWELHDMVERRHREANELLKQAHALFMAKRKPLYITNPALCSTIMAYLTT